MACRVELKYKNGLVSVGGDSPVRVNCNVGANTVGQMEYERKRLASIQENGLLPDCFMDLSIGEYPLPLYKDILQAFGCPVGTVPAYSFPVGSQVAGERALDILKRQADDGISFFTLHLTASEKLFKRALGTRKIPVTSRGGSIVLRQMLDTGEENIWLTLLPKIIDLASLVKEAKYKGTEEELWKELWEDRRSLPCFVYTEQIKDLMATGGILEISFYDFLDADESVKNRRLGLFDEKHYVYKYPLMAKGNSWLYVKSPSRFDVTVTNNGGDAVKPNQNNDPEIQSYTIFGDQTKDELEIKIGVKVPGTLKLWYRALVYLGYAFIAVFLGVALKACLSEASKNGFSIVYAQVGICIIAAIIATRGWLMNEETVLGKLSKRLTWIAIIIVALLVGVYSWFMLMK